MNLKALNDLENQAIKFEMVAKKLRSDIDAAIAWDDALLTRTMAIRKAAALFCGEIMRIAELDIEAHARAASNAKRTYRAQLEAYSGPESTTEEPS